MRVGVIRGDMPGPVLMADLETVSDRNVSTEAPGQVRYISRPTVAGVESALAGTTSGAGAVLNGSDISGSFPLTVVVATSDDLKLKTAASAAFTTYTIAAAAYTTIADYVAAINSALGSGSGITCRENVAGNGVALESDSKGVTSYLENDNEAGGSNANVETGLADGVVRTMVSAATLITDALPVGGPLDVSAATLDAAGAATAAGALGLIPTARGATTAVADAVAPQFIESPVVEDSMRAGHFKSLLDASFNPDSRRSPALANGAAIEVVQDDGTTAYTVGMPTITSATLDSPGAGDVAIVGTDLAGPGDPTAERKEVTVKVTGDGAPSGGYLSLSQELIEANGGTVTATLVVLPAALNTAVWATTATSVQVQMRSYASDPEALV